LTIDSGEWKVGGLRLGCAGVIIGKAPGTKSGISGCMRGCARISYNQSSETCPGLLRKSTHAGREGETFCPDLWVIEIFNLISNYLYKLISDFAA
jgi:hypothetical protein